MTSTSFNIKPPQRQSTDKRINYSKQGKYLSHKSNLNLFAQRQLNFTIRQNLKFQSIFDSFSSLMLKNSRNSDKKYFKSVSQAQISQIKLKFQYQNKKRKQRSLTSLLLGHNKQSKDEALKHRSKSRKRPSTSFYKSVSPSIIIQNELSSRLQKQTSRQQKQEKKDLLESTSFSIRSLNYGNKPYVDSQRCKLNISQKSYKNSSIRTTSSKHEQSSINIPSKKSLTILEQQMSKKTSQPEIQIRLSIKSLSKSQEGQKQVQKPQVSVMQKWINEQNKKLTKLQKSNITIKPSTQRKIILAGKSFKHSRMILKFDKKAILNRNEINDPCLKIHKIDSISSRLKTQGNI